MKTPILLGILTGLTALPLVAQDDSSNDAPKNDRKGPPPSRLVLTLDADHNKVISAAEIVAAPTALAMLDKDGDGALSKDEFARPKSPNDKKEKARDDENEKPSSQRPPPPDPLVKALDADRDRVISATEIADAATTLVTLDKNSDGQLTPDEFAPKPKRKPHGPRDGGKDDAGQGDDKDGQRPAQ